MRRSPGPAISYSIVRRTSMILAETGERVPALTAPPSAASDATHRTVTFETTPLLRMETLSENPYSPQRRTPAANSLAIESLKCSLAYTLSTLVVFTPLAGLFGNFSSKHLISTVCIYFHPARTVGAMIQACGYVLFALAYGVIVGLASMLTAHLLYDLEWFNRGVDILLFLYCGMAFSVLAYTKITVLNPTFDTACTVAIIFMVTIIIKEDNIQNGILGFEQLASYLGLVTAGVCITALMCFAIKPSHATVTLASSLTQLMDAISDAQSHILQAFAQGTGLDAQGYQESYSQMVASISVINTHLSHARFELFSIGQRSRYSLYEKIVHVHFRLVRHVGGLAHSAQVLSSLIHSSQKVDDLFREFITELGPPINSFATTVRDIMSNLPFDEHGNVAFNPIYMRSLKSALQLYSEARQNALYKVYAHSAFDAAALPTLDRSNPDSTDEEAIVAVCGNFSYIIEEIGDEIFNLLELLVKYEKETLDAKIRPNLKFLITLAGLPLWPEKFQPSKKSKPFSKLTEALYPKRQVQVTSIRLRLWKLLQCWNHYETKFAFKVGFGSVLLAIPAFTDDLRPYFTEWKGEWALIIYLIMMNRDLGAMTTSVKARLLGTLIGAGIAIIAWLVSPSALFLVPLGFLISLVSFQFILGPDRQLSSLFRFSIIAYNLVCLSNYNKRQLGLIDRDESLDALLGFAFHRVIAVSAGVVWALFITVCVFPDSARSAFRRILSAHWLRMGVVWKANPLGTMPRKDASRPAELYGIYGEEELQQEMVTLKLRLQSAKNEFRLKGKFDPTLYETLLSDTQAILNAYYSIGVLITKSPTASSKELELLAATRPEVDELCSMLFLYFYTASSSLQMGFPVPQELPSPQRALNRLLRTLQLQRQELLESPPEDADMEDFVLFYSYILVTITVTQRLTNINGLLGKLYGGLDSEIFSYT